MHAPLIININNKYYILMRVKNLAHGAQLRYAILGLYSIILIYMLYAQSSLCVKIVPDSFPLRPRSVRPLIGSVLIRLPMTERLIATRLSNYNSLSWRVPTLGLISCETELESSQPSFHSSD